MAQVPGLWTSVCHEASALAAWGREARGAAILQEQGIHPHSHAFFQWSCLRRASLLPVAALNNAQPSGNEGQE